jgi:hypothetical protein
MILELESNFPLIHTILLDPESFYGPPVKRSFLSLFMKKNFAADKLFGLAFFEFPTAAFPDIISQLLEIIHLFDYMYLHLGSPLSSSFILRENKQALSLCNGQGFNHSSGFPTREEVSSTFISDVDYIECQATPDVRISQDNYDGSFFDFTKGSMMCGAVSVFGCFAFSASQKHPAATKTDPPSG